MQANSKDVTSYAHYRGLNSGQICKNFMVLIVASGDASRWNYYLEMGRF